MGNGERILIVSFLIVNRLLLSAYQLLSPRKSGRQGQSMNDL